MTHTQSMRVTRALTKKLCRNYRDRNRRQVSRTSSRGLLVCERRLGETCDCCHDWTIGEILRRDADSNRGETLEDAALARLRLVFASKTVVVGSEKCNWVKWLQWGDEEDEMVGVEGMEQEEVRLELVGWGKRAKEGVEAKGAKDTWGAELGDK